MGRVLSTEPIGSALESQGEGTYGLLRGLGHLNERNAHLRDGSRWPDRSRDKSGHFAGSNRGRAGESTGGQRIVFETGRMATTLYHGLEELGLPVVCIERRHAHQALKSLATHKTDRNDARGLAHLARTGFYKPTHVKSLPAHAVRALIIARKKLVGQRVTLESRS